MKRLHVAILTKAPLPGKCKSRLAASIGDVQAAAFARLSLETIFDRLRAASMPFCVHPVDASDKTWFAQHYPQIKLGSLQAKGDLGLKMAAAVNGWLSEYTFSFVIGSDAPDAPIDDLAAFDTSDHTAVIGATGDGGFWCLGSNVSLGNVLAGLPWSSGQEYAATLAVLQKRGLAIQQVGKGEDVDTVEDLIALRDRMRQRDACWGKSLRDALEQLSY